MRWYFRDISNDPSEKELTQQDQFNNDEVALAEALVRETIQNSTDAQTIGANPVLVRFAITSPDTDERRQFLNAIVDGLGPHLAACNMARPSPNETMRLLTIEDFETTGLQGSVDEKDDGQFSGFWRRFGRSNKKDTQGGRWGLGKLVFPSVSTVRVVIGLTRSADKREPWLMGQAVLQNHSIGEKEMDSVGFWCREGTGKPGRPTNDPEVCAELCNAAGFRRRDQTGLSLAVPFIQPDITSDLLLAAVVKHYYFPILTGTLIVFIDETEVNSRTFHGIAGSLPNRANFQTMLELVGQIQRARESAPDAEISAAWQRSGISRELLGVEIATRLRDKFKNTAMVFVRVPIALARKGQPERSTYFDLFMKATQPGEKPQAIVVRGAITVPGEGKYAGLIDSHSALLATDDLVKSFLGDAENPAHTQWNERAEKLRTRWDRGSMALRRIRAALRELHEVIADKIEREDELAFVDFFSIQKPNRGQGTKSPGSRPDGLPPPKPKAFKIHKRAGGFAVMAGPGIETVQFPLKLRIRCAYDVLTGNPFKRYSELDFSFFRNGLQISTDGAHCWPAEPNEIDVHAEKPDFSVEVCGFDVNRDLVVEAQG